MKSLMADTKDILKHGFLPSRQQGGRRACTSNVKYDHPVPRLHTLQEDQDAPRGKRPWYPKNSGYEVSDTEVDSVSHHGG
jgi:hypothetical protein